MVHKTSVGEIVQFPSNAEYLLHGAQQTRVIRVPHEVGARR